MSELHAPPPTQMRAGDYGKRLVADTPDERAFARDAMRRQGCKSIRFEHHSSGAFIAHGYVGRFEGAEVEQL